MASGEDKEAPGAPGKRMSEPELLGLIKRYEDGALGSQVAAGATISTTVNPSNQALTTLQIDRYNALNAYMARPLGNEIENRSQIVMPTVRDTMGWIMPQLMRVFAGSKSVCRFDPENEQDEDQTETETEVVNQTFMTQNNGLMILHDFCWDALLMRNGYGQVYTREWTSVKEEKYTGLDQLELAQMLGDNAEDEIKVLEQREYTKDVVQEIPQVGPQIPPQVLQQAQQQLIMKVPCWDIKIRRRKKNRRIVVNCIPPEEMRVSARARQGMEDLSFAQHWTTKTRSELIEEGFDREIVNSIASGKGPNWLDIDALARNKTVDQLTLEDPSDFSMQEVEFRTTMIRVDFDGDGIAELR